MGANLGVEICSGSDVWRAVTARRGPRCPVRAHAVAVGALRRLRCAARSAAGAGELAARLQANAPLKQRPQASSRSAQARPAPDRTAQPPQKSPPPDTAWRDIQRNWGQTPISPISTFRTLAALAQSPGRAGRGARQGKAPAEFGLGPVRAAGALRCHARRGCLSGAPLAVRSEFRGAGPRPDSAGLPARSAGRLACAPRPARPGLCRAAIE